MQPRNFRKEKYEAIEGTERLGEAACQESTARERDELKREEETMTGLASALVARRESTGEVRLE